ncbi:MAG: hypothetical protein QXM13_05410, partial [Candidatus Bathyarchaeia archaeon]
MVSESYIDVRASQAGQAPATSTSTFYTEQRKEEYSSLAESLEALAAGSLEAYKQEAIQYISSKILPEFEIKLSEAEAKAYAEAKEQFESQLVEAEIKSMIEFSKQLESMTIGEYLLEVGGPQALVQVQKEAAEKLEELLVSAQMQTMIQLSKELESMTVGEYLLETGGSEALVKLQLEAYGKFQQQLSSSLEEAKRQLLEEFIVELEYQAEWYRHANVPASEIEAWKQERLEEFKAMLEKLTLEELEALAARQTSEPTFLVSAAQEIWEWVKQQETKFTEELKAYLESPLPAELKTQILETYKQALSEWEKQQTANLTEYVKAYLESPLPEEIKKQLLEAYKAAIPEWAKQQWATFEEMVSAELAEWRQTQYESFWQQVQPQIEEYAQAKLRGDVLTAAAVAGAIGAGILAPATAILGATSGLAATIGYSILIEKQIPSLQQLVLGASVGAISGIVTRGLFAGVGKIAPSIVASPIGRIALSTAYSTAVGAILSGGNIEKIMQSALIGLATSTLFEVLRPVYYELKAFLGRSIRLEEAEPTIGPGGEVKVWESQPLEELGGKSLKVVGSVTEYKAEALGISQEELIKATLGEQLPTAHATLQMESFTAQPGEQIMLTGYPEMAKGWRAAHQLYHFYSAPGDIDKVVLYGGYIGIGTDYSETAKIIYGGKPGAVVTLETLISPESLMLPGETLEEYLTRISLSSGETFIAPETVLGISREWQVITPAKYTRFGIELPGTYFQVEKVLPKLFQIKITPEGILGEIPGLREIFSQYHEFKVVVGEFVPTVEAPSVAGLAAAPPTVPTVAVSTTPVISLPTVHGFEPAVAAAVSLPTVELPTVTPSISELQLSLPTIPPPTIQTAAFPLKELEVKVEEPSLEQLTPSLAVEPPIQVELLQPTSIPVKPEELTVPSAAVEAEELLEPVSESLGLKPPETEEIVEPISELTPIKPITPPSSFGLKLETEELTGSLLETPSIQELIEPFSEKEILSLPAKLLKEIVSEPIVEEPTLSLSMPKISETVQPSTLKSEVSLPLDISGISEVVEPISSAEILNVKPSVPSLTVGSRDVLAPSAPTFPIQIPPPSPATYISPVTVSPTISPSPIEYPVTPSPPTVPVSISPPSVPAPSRPSGYPSQILKPQPPTPITQIKPLDLLPLGKIARKTIGYQLKARRRPIKSPAELRSYVLNVKLGSSPSKL